MKSYKEITNELLNRRDDYLKMIEENKMKRISKIAIPSCLIVLIMIGCIIMLTNNNKELKDDNSKLPEYENKIIINNLDNFENSNGSIAGGIYDIAGGFYEKAIEELENEYPFINQLFIFGTNTKNQRIGEYRYDTTRINYRGYYVLYTDDTEKKIVEIFFSKTKTAGAVRKG